MNTKYFKKWNEIDNFGKVLVLMALLAFAGFVVCLGGYEIVGIIIILFAVVVDNIALCFVAVRKIRGRRQVNENN